MSTSNMFARSTLPLGVARRLGDRPSTRVGVRHPPVSRASRAATASTSEKVVWVETTNVQVVLAALESGLSTTALFDVDHAHLASRWRKVGRFDALNVDAEGVIRRDDTDDSGSPPAVGVLRPVHGPEDVEAIAALAGIEPLVVMDSSAWKVIPAENLVAAFGATSNSTLMAVAKTAADATAMFEALEIGVDGVVLRTDDPAEARKLATYVEGRRGGGVDGASSVELSPATVTRVSATGVGDRACVDCASAFAPGEGLLVGSFAQGLLLVHSECLDAEGYVNSRPFRVNAGPLCSYVLRPGGRTAYLSELGAGDDVLCVASDGTVRVATVGRVKVEQRQMVLVEAEAEDGETFCALLQNAETVRLVNASGGGATSVSVLEPGDRILVHRQTGARHTGLKIEEQRWYER